MMIAGMILAILVAITAVYGFGFFESPYMGTFRVAFYFFLLFFVATIVVSVMTQSYQGYDPTPQAR